MCQAVNPTKNRRFHQNTINFTKDFDDDDDDNNDGL